MLSPVIMLDQVPRPSSRWLRHYGELLPITANFRSIMVSTSLSLDTLALYCDGGVRAIHAQ